MVRVKEFLKGNFITSFPMSILSKIVRLLKMIKHAKLLTLILKDKILRKGKDADIRLVYIGYIPFSHPKFKSSSSECIARQDSFFSFIETLTNQKVVVSWYKPSLIISSVFEDSLFLKLILKFSKTPSLFFSGENLKLPQHAAYKNYLDSLPDLALGFDYDSSYAHRFPLWLQYIFTGEFIAIASLQNIQDKLEEIEKNSFLTKEKFASMIASHNGYDKLSTVSRSEITQSLNIILPVSCAGKFLHNDDSLSEKFNDNKKEYLKDFVFNICPENTAAPGYVTEKIFESFEAGCIPIYWGDKNPEPDILNPKRIIFWQKDSDNKENLQLIKELYEDKEKKAKFLKEPVFVKDAHVIIYNYFLMLREKTGALLNK